MGPSEMDNGALGFVMLPVLLLLMLLIVGTPGAVMISAAVILGLPIRLRAAAQRWLMARRWLPWSLAVAGAALFVVIEFTFPARPWPTGQPFYTPSSAPLALAMLLIAMGITNLWNPRRRTRRHASTAPVPPA
ncbi:hypothetical protein [Agreia bicolorata]|uniref:hypothetical protein n=1 Tax=Agreia bicolorata TaxID=110935 RepID=UPI001115D238|nr:hypothetical protein [Agreia bicolorata]